MRQILIVLLLLLCGCSTYITVTVPAGESTVVSAPSDTTVLEELPPANIDGTSTEPVDVTVYEDTTARPTVELSFLEVDRTDPDDQTITARVEKDSSVVETTFKLPKVGESTHLFTADSGLEGTVFGAPMAREQEAITASIEWPWYMKLGRWIQLFGAMLFGGFLTYIVVKIAPGL